MGLDCWTLSTVGNLSSFTSYCVPHHWPTINAFTVSLVNFNFPLVVATRPSHRQSGSETQPNLRSDKSHSLAIGQLQSSHRGIKLPTPGADLTAYSPAFSNVVCVMPNQPFFLVIQACPPVMPSSHLMPCRHASRWCRYLTVPAPGHYCCMTYPGFAAPSASACPLPCGVMVGCVSKEGRFFSRNLAGSHIRLRNRVGLSLF